MQQTVNKEKEKNRTFELEDVKDIIKEEIEKKKSSLDDIIWYIQEESNINLNAVDCAYIKRKYISYCSKLWLQEVTNFLIEVRNDNIKQPDVVQEISSKISAIQSINQVPAYLGKLLYYDLLLKHYQLIDRETERIILDNCKERCFEQLIGCSDTVRKELAFLEALKDFLSSSETLKVIARKLSLSKFCTGDISFDELLKIIINLETKVDNIEFITLQNTAKFLKGKDHFFLLNEVREIIEAYIAPVKILNKRLDNRSFIEIKGRIINIDEVLVELESQLENTKDRIDEVHFVGSDSVHIHVNLQKNIWRGKNIVIYTNVIKVHDVVTWNVSGQNTSHEYSDNAGTGTDGNGINGADGYAGESGGNVKIFAKIIQNPEKWTIVSNGGNGGTGQDGGNGKDGSDGKGIQTSTFCDKFPSIVSFVCPRNTRASRLDDMVDYIKSLGTVKTSWRSGHVFMKVETAEGNEITFSYCTGTFTTRYQAFLLYGGSLGKSGGQGGECGLGGQAGYSGKIDVCNPDVKVVAKSGQNGSNGKGGLYGTYGKNGWDMAYIDYQNWRDTIFYGRDMQSKLTLEYYETDNAECTRIWCPYYDKYAEISARSITHQKQKMYNERRESKNNRALQKQALAVRKNTIISTTFDVYCTYCNHVDDILQKLKFNLEQKECDVVQIMHENENETKKQEINIEVNTRRCANSTCLSKDKSSIQSSLKVTKIFKKADKEKENSLIKILRNSKSFKDWFAIKNKPIPYSDLKQLFIIFDKIRNTKKQNKIEKHEIQIIEEMLIWKYKFSSLQEIATQLLSYQSSSKNEDERSLPINIEKYLIVAKNINNKVSHNILGTLNQYIFDDVKEQRLKICRFFKEHLLNEDYKTLKCSIKAFILEKKDTEKINPHVEKYRNEYLEYLQKKSHNVDASLKVITKELERRRELYDLWIECVTDKSKEHILEDRMKKDKFMFMLYRHFKNQLKKEYDWDVCCKDKSILKEHGKHMQDSGFVSVSYRELLASVFDVNIQIYTRDENNNFSLSCNHNRSSERNIYLLQRNNEYMQLEVDEDYLRLNNERKWKNNLYAQILKNIELFTKKEQFDEYLKCRTFLSFPNVHNVKLEPSLNDEEYANEEGVNIDKILNYFSVEADERSQMRRRLEKLKYEFIGQRGFLYRIAQNFLHEGRHISTQVLYYLINSILSNIVQGEVQPIIFHWIIISHSQQCWLIELIFLQLENYFKKPLIMEQLKWRECLSKIDEDILMLLNVKLDREKFVSVQCIDEILYLLSNISNEVEILEDLGLSEWPYFLKEEYWTSKLLNLVEWKENDELLTASYYVLSVENNFGTVVVEKLLDIIQTKKEKFTSNDLIYILCNFHNENWQLDENALSSFCMSNLVDWMKMMEDQLKLTNALEERNVVQLISLIKDNSNTSSRIREILPEIKKYILDDNAAVQHNISSGKSIYKFTESDIKKWVKNLNDLETSTTPPTNAKSYIEERYAEVLAVVDRAIELKKGFKLRDTQKLSALMLLVNKSNTLEQVSTGEGKSLIVVTVSIVKVLCGEKVDIITSSSVLAKRDAEDNRSIYKLFDISVSHNCDEITENRKAAYSNNQIVYGDLSSFQRDYLLDRFYKRNILGNRTFDNIIVDEVDSMLLDKGNNMLYLSHDLAGLDKIESIYIYIWQLVNKPCGSFDEFRHTFNPKIIKEAVLYDIYGLITEEDIKTINSSLKKEEMAALWGRLVDVNIVDNRGRLLLKKNFTIDQIVEILPSNFRCYAAGLHYLIDEVINRERFIDIPNYLKTFVEEHLDAWINNARIAVFMEERYDYIVDIDRSGTSSDRNPRIIILDRDTGTDQNNSQWDEALHQFLQLKHGCKLSLQSLKAVFVSNVSYLKLYSNLYGLSGTLGLHGERSLLEKIYNVDFVIVPTAKPKQFYEMKPILCNNKAEWMDEICKMANKLTTEKLRSVLIICETVKDVEKLYMAFGGKTAKNVHTYLRDYEEFDIVKGDKEMEQNQIIIATNLAGRGTDIKITRELSKAGGLHVCLTFLPNNARIEQQAFGRAARSGNKGSGQLIIINPEEKQIFRLKKQRDVEELSRISQIKDHYEKRTLIEEDYFNRFKQQYEKLDKHLDECNVSDTFKDILLQCCLDEWAFWLDRNNKYITNTVDEKREEILEKTMDHFIQKQQSKCKQGNYWLAWVTGHPVYMLKLGVHLAEQKFYDEAIALFNKIINQEPDFSMEARYYKAFAIGKKINWEKKDKYKREIKEFKELLKTVSNRLEILRGKRMCAASVINQLNGLNNEGIIKIDAYATQQKSVNEVYSMFSKTIDDIFGHPVNSQYFIGYNVKETLADTLYEDMIEMGILDKPKVKKNIPKTALNKISYDYNVPIEKLTAFLDMYKGKDINEHSFIKELKKNIVMTNRETFWKLLIKEGVLTNELIYVVLNKEKLNDYDPSSLNILLKGQINDESENSLTVSNFKQVFLYAEQVNANKDAVMLEKDYIKRTIGEAKYCIFKKKGIFPSSNKLARVNTEKLQSIIFPQYDSITLNDFNKINIVTEEAEKILAELVTKEVLAKDNINNNLYRLITPYTKIQELELSFRPVYESNVKVLLTMCFAYRIALQRMEEDLTQDCSQLIRLHLVAKPHKNLFCALTDENIVKPAKVTIKCINIESILKEKYPQKMNKARIMDILEQSNLIPLKFCNKKLFDNLMMNQWILPYYSNVAADPVAVPSYLNTVVDMINVYKINNSREGRKTLDLKYRDIEETLHVILDNIVQLSKDETIVNIVSVLGQLRNTLKTLECPDPHLKPLLETDANDFANIEEIHIFILNGHHQLLTLTEKQWTLKMLLRTGLVMIIGMCQVMVGVLIELFSAGAMTHVGAAFISEGISDIIFAGSALTSGYFSWKDYRQHKIQSLMTTVATLGIAMYFSRGVKFSHFGHKVGGTSLGVGKKKLSELAGKQLFESMAKSTTNVVTVSITKEVVKRVSLKILEGMAFGLANASIDMLLQNYLRSFCDSLTFTVLSDIQKKVAEHPHISLTLRNSCKVLGKEDARKMVNNLTKIMSKDKSYTDKLLSVSNQIFTCVTQGIMQATDKVSKANNSISNMPMMNIISKIFTLTEYASHLASIKFITNEYLNQMQEKIQKQLDYKKSDRLKEKTEVTDEECKEFEREIVDQWKLVLRAKAEQIIAQHIVGPILKGFAKKLVRFLGKVVNMAYRCCKEDMYFKEFKRLQRQFKSKLKDLSEHTDIENKNEIEVQIRKEYDNNLIQLLAKTRNPSLFAAIVEEGTPMESTCVKSCVKVISIALKKKGINVKPFTLNVIGENGAWQKIPSEEEINGQCINLKLIDNHFTLLECDSSNINSDGESDSRNNCLFEALKRAIPELNHITPEEFRKYIADYIRNDPSVKYYLSQAWHRLPLAYNFVGGDRRETKRINSKKLKEKIKDGSFKFSQSSIATHTKDDHVHVGELSESIKKNKWKGKPVRVVEISEDNYTALDHRRVLAVAISDDPNVEMEMAIYGPEDEFSSETNDDKQYTKDTNTNIEYETTAGSLAKKRMRSGSLEYNDSMHGFNADQVRIRLTPSNYEYRREYENRLEDLGFQMGGPKRNKKGNSKHFRSKSAGR